jgi:protein-disulfide isomerase
MSMAELEEQGEIAKLSLPVTIKRDHIQGKSDARVTLVEYGDYECPYCGQAYMIVKEIQKQLKDQLRFVFRNFPLTQIHPHAQQTAEAAEAAGVQKKFWDMHDILYENQQALDYYHLVEYATILGLDIERFNNDLFSHVHAGRVREDFISGVRSGVNGTPTFFVNGVRYNDSWDYGTFLDRLLFIIKQSNTNNTS